MRVKIRSKKENGLFAFRKILFLPIILLAVLCLVKRSRALDNSDPTGDYYKNLIIAEIMYDPKGSNANKQWVEIYNDGDEDIHLLKEIFGIVNDHSPTLNSRGDAYLNCHGIDEDITVPAKGYILLTNYKNDDFYKDYPGSATVDIDHSALSLPSKEGSVRLSGDKCKHFFLEVEYTSDWGGDNNGNSLEKNELDDHYEGTAWHESCAVGGTPGSKNSQKGACDDPQTDEDPDNDGSNDPLQESPYFGKVFINEIYPAPLSSAGEEEFVEIIDKDGGNIDFKDWTVNDGKGNKPKLSRRESGKNFCVLYGSFSLNNNSKGDTVNLFDENGVLVDSKNYFGTKSKFSYAFDGSAWRWTSQPTPGEENMFDKIPKIKIEKDDDIYANIYALFSANVEDQNDATRFTWDFGDNHKSYLQDTKHAYEKAGTYAASLRVHDKKIDEMLNFEVEVKKYEAPKIRIVRFSPNPKGSDTNNEFILIANKSKNNINLKGWSIATGWGEMYNHPIREDFKIKKNKSKKLTHDICAFTLNNEKTKIELRDPAGKVVQSVKYDRTKNKISEDEIYEKTDSGWEWLEPQTVADETQTVADQAQTDTDRNQTNGENNNENHQASQPIDPNLIGKYSTDPIWENKNSYRIKLAVGNLGSGNNLGNNSYVLGTATIHDSGDQYYFTPKKEQKHWAVNFMERLWIFVNFHLNKIINLI